MEISPTPDHWQEAARKALTALWGVPVVCTIKDTLRAEGRNRVYRLAVAGGPVSTVILKASLGDSKTPYVMGDDRPDNPFHRFCNEWAGCAMMGPIGFGPTAYTGDPQQGFYLMSDLGAGISLADRLTGSDPALATDALLAYAHTLGELHAATQGQSAHWQALRAGRAGSSQSSGRDSWRAQLSGFAGICQRHAVALSSELDSDLAKISAVIDNPGPYDVFSPTDCCPDNHFLHPSGRRVIFFDCEWATMRHALLDVAYFIAPFPTCWCTSRLPDGMPGQMVAAYREHFFPSHDFEDQLTLVLAGWVLATLSWSWAGDWEKQDHRWGLISLRQRHLHRLENLLAQPNFASLLPALAPSVHALHHTLKSNWQDLEPAPLYAAFRKGLL